MKVRKMFRSVLSILLALTMVLSQTNVIFAAGSITVLTQPEDYYGAEGGIAVFKVRATGEGLSYLWQYRTSETGEWMDATTETGYNTSNMCISMVSGLDNYSYRCIVKNSLGETLETPAVSLKYLPVPEGYEEAYIYMSLLLSIDEKLNELGLDWQTLQDMPQKDEAFYNEMFDILEREGADLSFLQNDDPSLGVPSATANARAFALCYAHAMAELSIAQEDGERTQRDVNMESMYMILSHYVDVPGMNMSMGMNNLLILDNSLVTNNENAKWITEYDRQAYDEYLSHLGSSEVLQAWLTLIETIGSIVAGKYVNLSQEIIQSEQVLKKLDNMSDDVDLFQTGYNGVGVILSYYKNADHAQTAAELYDLMKMDYMEKASSEMGLLEITGIFLTVASFTLNVVQLLAGNPFPMLVSITSSLVSTATNAFVDIFKSAAWAGMTQSRNMRISYRYMRMYGMI